MKFDFKTTYYIMKEKKHLRYTIATILSLLAGGPHLSYQFNYVYIPL